MQAAAIVAGPSGLVFLPAYGWLPGSGLAGASWTDLALQGVLIGVVSVFAYTRAVARRGAAKMVASCPASARARAITAPDSPAPIINTRISPSHSLPATDN